MNSPKEMQKPLTKIEGIPRGGAFIIRLTLRPCGGAVNGECTAILGWRQSITANFKHLPSADIRTARFTGIIK